MVTFGEESSKGGSFEEMLLLWCIFGLGVEMNWTRINEIIKKPSELALWKRHLGIWNNLEAQEKEGQEQVLVFASLIGGYASLRPIPVNELV